MKTLPLNSVAFAAALLLNVSTGSAETARDVAPTVAGACTTAATPGEPGTESQSAAAPAPQTATYRWKTLFAGDETKPHLGGIAVDAAENVYVVKECTVARISPEGKLITLAGKEGDAGTENGAGAAARFTDPLGLALDGHGNLYLSEKNGHTIRKITAAGLVTTFAGSFGQRGCTDGPGENARFCSPAGIAVDGQGNVYVGDTCNSCIRRITPEGAVSTLAGRVAPGQIRRNAAFDEMAGLPGGLAADAAGNVYFVHHLHHVIRRTTSDGTIMTVGGVDEGSLQVVDGPRSSARFRSPLGLAIDLQGNIYVADTNSVRKVSPDGTVTTIGGDAGAAGSAEGAGSAPRFARLRGVAVSSAGVVYVTTGASIVQGTPVH